MLRVGDIIRKGDEVEVYGLTDNWKAYTGEVGMSQPGDRITEDHFRVRRPMPAKKRKP